MKTAKTVKKLIAEQMTDRKNGVSVALGECNDQYERILIHFRPNFNHLSLNPITKILQDNNFYVAQIVSFWKYPKDTLSILLIREPKKRK